MLRELKRSVLVLSRPFRGTFGLQHNSGKRILTEF
jgi:hypothetical protein